MSSSQSAIADLEARVVAAERLAQRVSWKELSSYVLHAS